MALSINYTYDVRKAFIEKYKLKCFTGNTVELQGVSFRVTEGSIFGTPNEDYIKAEIEWYESQSLDVDDLAKIYGKRVKIWDSVANYKNCINSNYGWCIYSNENGNQYSHAVEALWHNPNTRQSVMHYTRPAMHTEAVKNGGNDFMCTYAVQYFNNSGYLDAHVYMRSNDAVFGFNNDVAWQKHVLTKMAQDTNLTQGVINWNVGSMHVYDRHYGLIENAMR